MLPVITIGSASLSTYALMYALGILVGGSRAIQAMRGISGDPDVRLRGLLLVIAGIVVGLFVPGWIESRVQALVTGGPPPPMQMRVYSGLATCLLVGYLYTCVRHHLSLLEPLDRLVGPFALGYSICRLGCLAAGCCGGAVTGSLLGMYAPDNQGAWAVRYPTQVMSGLFQFALFLLSTWLCRLKAQRRKDPRFPAWLQADGVIFYGYVFFFCLERFSLEFLRFDYHPVAGPFSLPHLYMLAGMLATLSGLFYVTNKTFTAKTEKLAK